MKIGLSAVYSLVDSAILYFSKDKWLDKWQTQKSVFYFLWLYSSYKKLDFLELAKKLEIEPEKQGPYSLSIEGEVETLIRDGFLKVLNQSSKNLKIKASSKGINEIKNLKKEEKIIMNEVDNLINKLRSDELVFFIYFNPYIPKKIKDYFLSKSEIKNYLLSNKRRYINKLLNLEIIDVETAEKIANS